MSGPGAEFSPFSQTVNLVLHFIPKAGGEELDPARRKQFIVDTRTRDAEFRMKATRQLCLKAAKFLAGKVKGMTPDHTRSYELGPVDPETSGSRVHVQELVGQLLRLVLHNAEMGGADAP